MLADRAQIREAFYRAREKYRARAPVAGAEKLIVDVATRHPEYHLLLQDRNLAAGRFAPADAASAFLPMCTTACGRRHPRATGITRLCSWSRSAGATNARPATTCSTDRTRRAAMIQARDTGLPPQVDT